MRLRHPIRIADHEVEVTGRVVRFILRGDFSEADVRLYAQHIDAMVPRGEPYIAMANVVDANGLGAPARRFLTSWHKGHRCERIAICGASVVMRALMSLAVRALSLIGSRPIELRFYSAEAEAEAEAWFAEWETEQQSKASQLK
jgi:hypothetical protein